MLSLYCSGSRISLAPGPFITPLEYLRLSPANILGQFIGIFHHDYHFHNSLDDFRLGFI